MRTAINVEDVTAFGNEFRKLLKYTCNDNEDIDTCNIKFFHSRFNGQTAISTGNC